MISVDTTFLIDLWRNREDQNHPAVKLLADHSAETFCVAAHAAGEFLEGGACISPSRYLESLQFVSMFHIAPVTLETATHYARTVSFLRGKSLLSGASKPDLWIAAAALELRAPLVTRNLKHFKRIPDLKLISY